MFGDRYRLVGYYENVGGLIPSAPVWLAGTRVGRVESVNLGTREDGQPAVKVVLQIDEDVQERIRADSTASIGTIGLLGDRYVEVSLGSPGEPMLEDGAEIRTASPGNLARVIDTGTEALDNIATLAGNLNEVVEGFQKTSGGEGLAGLDRVDGRHRQGDPARRGPAAQPDLRRVRGRRRRRASRSRS